MKDGKIKKILLPIYNRIESLYGCLFPYSRSKYLYKKLIGRKLTIEDPKTLNEKLMYYKFKVYWKNNLVNECADKLRVRDYVKKRISDDILNPIYGSWSNVKDIDWDLLPNEFVLKTNCGSGQNIVCSNKDTFDKKAATKKLNKWMRSKFGNMTAEQGIYCKIKRKIFAEKYIESYKDSPPDDYKFFCSYGEVKLMFTASDRYDDNTKFDYYTPDWKWIDVKNCHPNKGPVSKPKNYEKMLEYASLLSKQFPLVRIDFYDVDGKILFGEMTFTHFGCIHPFTPDSYDLEFGELFPSVYEADKIL